MNIQKFKLTKNNEKGKIFENKTHQIFNRVKGSISGDNEINPFEKITFISGNAKLTIKDKISEISEPCYFEIPENTYLKIEAVTDVSFMIEKSEVNK